MRLLERHPNGELVLHEFLSTNLPAYATLSHTWGADSEEVSFQDIEAGTGKSKAGYHKIQFCAKQASTDGLRYFWVDTCCIDKKNAVELSEAINSMFRWYEKAARCYVYLPDVSIANHVGDPHLPRSTWEPAFRQSRWFTRGWTLQELIAPKAVEFFALEGRRLGSRLSLGALIHDITGISETALTGRALSNFSVDERMSWAAQRNTKLEEDAAYCMLGIFDVYMPLIYGEGRQNAIARLHREIRDYSFLMSLICTKSQALKRKKAYKPLIRKPSSDTTQTPHEESQDAKPLASSFHYMRPQVGYVGAAEFTPDLEALAVDSVYRSMPFNTELKRIRARDYSRFYKIGRVFKCLWIEPANLSLRGDTVFTCVNILGSNHSGSIRRFVVISSGSKWCTCLPIHSYRGQGTLKQGVNSEEHALIYIDSNGKTRPPEPLVGEDLYKHPFRVKPGKGILDVLSTTSRLNFGRAYTVEYSALVCNIGCIQLQDQPHLSQYFKQVHAVRQVKSSGGQDDESDETEEYDETEETLEEKVRRLLTRKVEALS